MIMNLDFVYPIGSIYLSMNSTNPSKYFGGTWKQISQGRCLVGVDTTQTEFDEVNKTGGSKYLQAHTHKTTQNVFNANGGGWYYIGWLGVKQGTSIQKEGWSVTSTQPNVTTGDSGNLQPYLTCYIWQRTA